MLRQSAFDGVIVVNLRLPVQGGDRGIGISAAAHRTMVADISSMARDGSCARGTMATAVLELHHSTLEVAPTARARSAARRYPAAAIVHACSSVIIQRKIILVWRQRIINGGVKSSRGLPARAEAAAYGNVVTTWKLVAGRSRS